MVLSLITLAATVPLLATSTMQLSDQANNTSSRGETEIKTQKCNFSVRASRRMSPKRRQELADRVLVLRDGRLVLDHKLYGDYHPFTAYFLPYPEKSYDGLVTTVNDENFLNWVYIESSTHRVKHGIRAEAEPQLTGPMGLVFSRDGEKRLSFEGWEGFVVVEEEPGQWALYFDRDDNGLGDKAHGKPVIEVELIRLDHKEKAGRT
ncbi:uncharacterized protein Z518_02466 [Rhinocladiella mackenziei CBS 650.93]|uniref:Uncharacterized protein n=1 Tax=Rhinocladiella mackenziei CBS 650.93 TaxID=1442369 RepID=A0A0D2FZS1_9EURO|nr:uncharacterized protein Z518_02466 [Rhinocladiella mackenziei CBS 650.93]KIX07812.1 hypothetical protein Z518_02466 [Rhinocladiella mackenziei CBS 650.93]